MVYMNIILLERIQIIKSIFKLLISQLITLKYNMLILKLIKKNDFMQL